MFNSYSLIFFSSLLIAIIATRTKASIVSQPDEEKGKDQQTASQLRQARISTMKFTFFVSIAVLGIIGIGGAVGAIVHYGKVYRETQKVGDVNEENV